MADKNKGFTLLEVMIALAVLAFGLLAITQMTIIYVNTNTFNHMMSQSTVLSQDKMEELQRYARSERVSKFSPLDFDYLVGTQTNFTALLDTTGASPANFTIDALLSNGDTKTAPWQSDPEDPLIFYTMNDAGTGEDEAAADGVYTGTDNITVLGPANNVAYTMKRIWTVEPLDPDTTDDLPPDYAHLTATTSWIDKNGKEHDVELESLVQRRQ